MIAAWLLALAPGVIPVSPAGGAAEIETPALRAHVYRLASADFLGRRGAGAARASRYIADAFTRLKLPPAFGDSYFQPIPWLLADRQRADASFIGRNVAAVLPGSDPVLRDEWIVVAAHYDHLGQFGGRMYPGADDNASGVAMLLEVARQLGARGQRPRRTILFVAFDQEEAGLLGSMHFAAHPPRDFGKLKAVLVADMLGRSMAGVMDEYVFALGSEHSAGLRALLEGVRPPRGLKVGRIGVDLIGTRSDYGPFRDRAVPFLFFSTGPHADYHRPTDLPDRIDYAKLTRISRWIRDLTWRLAMAPTAPKWDAQGLPPDFEEARTLRELLSRMLANPGIFHLPENQRPQVVRVRNRLEEIVRRGRVTPGERTWMVWTARLLMLSLF